jgi:biopolymer transport protein ExbD
MRSQRHSAESEETGIDLAPMLDFVLNLLIFFIITTSFVREAGVTVAKPEAATAVLGGDKANILIAVRSNGEIWMDRRQVDLREVRPLVERLHIERPDDTVIVVADKDAKTGLLAQVMDEVKLGGIDEVAIGAGALGGD